MQPDRGAQVSRNTSALIETRWMVSRENQRHTRKPCSGVWFLDFRDRSIVGFVGVQPVGRVKKKEFELHGAWRISATSQAQVGEVASSMNLLLVVTWNNGFQLTLHTVAQC